MYKSIRRLEMLDPKLKLLHKLNAFALIAVMIASAVGVALNYFLRMPGEPGGMYFVYILCGVAADIIYPYFHEFAHAFAVMIIKWKLPTVKFGKLAAYCGAPDTIFTKLQYFFVASFPFLLFCGALIPLCIFIPCLYFPPVFLPLVYNLFGSLADGYMFAKTLSSPRRCVVVDGGTDLVIYTPVAEY